MRFWLRNVLRYSLLLFILSGGPAIASLSNFNDGLLARFSFNEGSTTTSSDSAGWSRDASLGGDAAEVLSDKSGYALHLDGVGDYGVLASSEIDTFNTDYYSYSVWIKPDVVNVPQAVISNHRSCGTCGTPGGYGLFINATGTLGAHTYRASDDSLVTVISTSTITAGVWTHVAVTFDGTDLNIYINGALDKTTTALSGETVAPTTFPMAIGTLGFQAATSTHSPYGGEIDEVRIYDRGLLDTEVAALHSGAGGEPGATFYESFDDETSARNNNGYDDTGVNATFVSNGRYGGGLQINGTNGPSLDVTGALVANTGSITFQYRPDWSAPAANPHTLLQTDTFCGGATGSRYFRVNTYGDSMNFSYQGNGDYDISKSSVSTSTMEPAGVGSFVAGEWYDVEVVWGPAGWGGVYLIVVVDGVVANISYGNAGGNGTPPNALYMGNKSGCAAGWNFEGTIDELKVYSDVTYDRDDAVGEYIRRARDDGKLQAHETKQNSPDDWNLHETSLGSSTFYQLGQFEFAGDGYVPDNGENTTQPFQYVAAPGESETLFFNYYSDTDLGDVTASVVGGQFSSGGGTLSDVTIRTVMNWFQSAPAAGNISQLIPSYTPELLVHDATTDLGADDWRIVVDDGAGNLSANLPSFTLNDNNLTKVNVGEDTSTQLAVTVRVPPGAASGTYTATVEIVDGNSVVVDTLNIELDVLGTVLEEADKELLIFHEGKYSQFSCSLGQVGPDNEKDCRQFMADGGNLSGMDRYLAEIDNLAAHGINGVFNYNDPVDLAEANQIVANYVFKGIDHRVMFGDAHPAQNWGVYSDDAYNAMTNAYNAGFLESPPTFVTRDEPGFKDLLGGHLSNVATHNAMGGGVGADSITALFYDSELCLRDGGVNGGDGDGDTDDDGCEPNAMTTDLVTQQPVSVLENLGNIFGKAPRTAPGCGGSECEPPNYPQLDLAVYQAEDVSARSSMPGYINSLLQGGSRTANASLPTQKELYYWQSRLEDPRVNRYYAGYFLYLTGFDGFMPYTYYQPLEGTNPYDDYDIKGGSRLGQGGFNREHMMSYPSSDGPVDTVQWEAFREGIDDYRYLQTWETLHDAMVSQNPAQAASSYNTVQAALVDYRANIDGVLSNNTIADFENTRAIVIAEIGSLQQGLQDDDGDGLSNAAEAVAGSNPNHPDHDRDGIRDGDDIAPVDRFSPNASGTNLSLASDFSDPEIDDNSLTVSTNDTIYIEVWDSTLNGTQYNAGPSYIDISTGGVSNNWDSCSNTTSNTVCAGSTGSLSLSTGQHLLELRVKTKGGGNGTYNDAITITAQ